jgi:hypothetical protein
MLKLPFVTEPQGHEVVKVGSPEMGELEIPKFGTLSLNERLYLKKLTKEIPDLRYEAVKMSKAIAAESGSRVVDIYNALTTSNTAVLSEHLDKVLEFQDKLDEITTMRGSALATVIIAFRLVPDWTLAHTGDANLIHPDLVQAVAEFAAQEEQGWAEAPAEAQQPSTDEELGNS